MTIVSMDVVPIRVELGEPIPMASGPITSTGNVLVKLTTSDGVAGWGEGVEAPAVTGATQSSILADLETLAPVVIGSDPARPADLWARCREAAPGGSTALAAIDIAVHDVMGKIHGLPLHALIGGQVRDHVPALTLVGSGDYVSDVEKLETKRRQGFSWFKVKVGMAPRETEWRTIETAMEIAGDAGVVCADANGAWDEEQAVAFLEGLDGMGVRFLEQPVPGLEEEMLQRLAATSPVAICADESAADLDSVIRLAGTAIGGVSLKLIKHGGVTGVMRGAGICVSGGLEVNLAGKVIETSISAAANLHCAAAMESIEYGCSPANQGLVADVTQEPVTAFRGGFAVPSGPGLGVEVDPALVTRLTVAP